MEKPINKPVTDLTYLDTLCEGDIEFKKDLIRTFIGNSTNTMDKMKICLQESNWKRIGDLAHSLKPSLTIMGMNSDRETALKIENYGKQKKLTGEIMTLVNDLEIKLSMACDELRMEINKLNKS